MFPSSSAKASEPSGVISLSRFRTLPFAFVCLTLVTTAILAPPALLVLLTDGSVAIAVALGAMGWGCWPTRLLRLDSGGWGWFVLGSLGLGLGILAAIALALGAAGIFSKPAWWGVLVFGFVLGATALARRRAVAPLSSLQPARLRSLWTLLILVPFLTLGILSAATPPGVLWAEEGHGYDVLEYHLAVPAEYLTAGRIEYLPHNVYASFPSNVEMLYLWTMVLRGDAIASMYTAKMLNLLLGVLAVWGMWLAGREIGPRAGVVAALLLGGQGWLVYLSGVAYVENGLLFFGALAFAAMLRTVQRSDESPVRWAFASGLMAGLSCGCKYSAMGMIAAPALAVFVLRAATLRGVHVRAAALFLCGCAVSFGPWLVKNAALTGDPIFPLGRQVFADYPSGWDAERDAHFIESHRPRPQERPWPARFKKLWENVIREREQRIGVWLWPLVLAAAWLCRRDRRALFLLAILMIQLSGWLVASHLYARFAVPMLIPLALLIGRLAEVFRARHTVALFFIVIGVGLANNLFFAARLYAAHLIPEGRSVPVHGLDARFMAENWPGFAHLASLNRLPEGARVLMVGDARGYYLRCAFDYCVVFNRNPLAERIENGAAPHRILDWLRERNFSHVYVNWVEIKRLRKSAYGFSPAITPEFFKQLEAAGLLRVETYRFGDDGPEYGTLYALPDQ